MKPTNLLLAIVLLSVISSAAVHVSATASGDKPYQLTLWRSGDPGQQMILRGQVTSTDGRPISGATVDVRQADGNGDYHSAYQGSLITNSKGEYALSTAVPGNYTGARHIHFIFTHEDYSTVYTEAHFKGDDAWGENPPVKLSSVPKLSGWIWWQTVQETPSAAK